MSPSPRFSDTILRVPPRFRVLKVGDEEYKFVSLTESVRARPRDGSGMPLDKLLPLLRAGAKMEDLLEAVETAEEQAVQDVVADLLTRGLLEESPDGSRSATDRACYHEQEKFFSNFPSLPTTPPREGEPRGDEVSATRKLETSKVLLLGLGRVGSRLAGGLAHAGVGEIVGSDAAPVAADDMLDSGFGSDDLGTVREQALAARIEHANPAVRYSPLDGESPLAGRGSALPAGFDLLVLCEDHFDPEHFDLVNRFSLDHKVTWTSYRAIGTRYEIGPTIVPWETACFQCLDLRKASNLDFYEDLSDTQRLLKEQGESVGTLNLTLGYEVLALEVVKILSAFSRPITYGAVYTFDLLSLEAKTHPVLKIPRCPACSPLARQRPAFKIWDPGDMSEL